MKRIQLILIVILFTLHAAGQEYLTGISSNPQLKTELLLLQTEKAMMAADTLELPFFDDFSASKVFPSSALWEDNFVFINNNYGVNPPSIGVATFDAISFDGSIYEDAGSTPFLADQLTSKAINLSGLTLADSVFMSFYYQPQGLGDNPEYNDSLYLELYSPESSSWYWFWGAKGTVLQDFSQVILQIPDTAYDGSKFLMKGFRFRFSNLASLVNLTEQPFASNCDQWNLDYLYLNTNRNSGDTILSDLTFLNFPAKLLKEYTAMPYRHFTINASQLTSSYNLNFSNSREDSMIVSFGLDIYNIQDGGAPTHVIPGGTASANFPPGDTIYTNNLTGNPFLGNSNPTKALFKIQGIIKPGEAVADFSANNDTAWYYQYFDNYYAYDDGTAESGYGLAGDGTQNAMVAYRFRNYVVNDSLRAVQCYFNQTLNNASQDYFYLMVWDHNSATNRPGNLLYSQIGVLPQYGDSLNQFLTYRFKTLEGLDTAIVVPDTFYVGWKQTTTDLLNVGFDKNSVRNTENANAWSNPYLYYNISGSWQSSAFEGALMFRPVFQFDSPLAGIKPIAEENNFRIFPNPADDLLTIDFTPSDESAIVKIYDIQGKEIYNQSVNQATVQINLDPYDPGIYFVRLISGKNQSTRKLIIQ